MSTTYVHPWYSLQQELENTTLAESQLLQKPLQDRTGEKPIDEELQWSHDLFDLIADHYPFLDTTHREKCDEFLQWYAAKTGKRYD